MCVDVCEGHVSEMREIISLKGGAQVDTALNMSENLQYEPYLQLCDGTQLLVIFHVNTLY